MIVEFSVKNFRSIKDLQTISFVAAPLKSAPEYAEVDENNIVEEGGMRLLKTVGIYGPNSSGKSNVIKALQLFLNFVSMSASPTPTQNNLHQPFLFQSDNLKTESFFQIVFIVEGKKYRYGFTIIENVIRSEWLYGLSAKNMVAYFIRNHGQNPEIKEPFREAYDVPNLGYNHNLFLTHVASYKQGEAYKIWNYLFMYTRIIFNARADDRRRTVLCLRSKTEHFDGHYEIIKFLSSFNIQYDKIDLIDSSLSHQSEYPLEKFFVLKNGVLLNMATHESDGALKLFDISGPIISSLQIGGLIIQDELDSNFHPSLLIKLIKMYNDPKINKGHGQLLFTTHDTNLLAPSIMRRDQFYFTEKDANDATKLYSLADLKGIRNDADFAKQYLAGYYGALPVLEDYMNEEKVGKDE